MKGMTKHEANWQIYGVIEEMKAERIKRGKSLKVIAELIGVTRPTLAELENGIREPKAGTLMAYASELGYEIVIRKK